MTPWIVSNGFGMSLDYVPWVLSRAGSVPELAILLPLGQVQTLVETGKTARNEKLDPILTLRAPRC